MKHIKAIEIEINSNCNRACSYCPNVNQTRVEQGFMSEHLFHKILLQLQQINYSGRISFSFYNEPLLHPELRFFSSQVKKYLPKVNILIYTNGTLLDRSRFDDLIENGVDFFVVTKHEKEKNYIFDKVFSTLSEEIKEKHVKFQSYNELKLTNRGGLVSKIKKVIQTQDLPCTIALHMLTITNKGSIVPCFEDYHQVHSMGNLNNSTLEEIWNTPEYRNFRKKLLMGMRTCYEVCSRCNRTEMLLIH